MKDIIDKTPLLGDIFQLTSPLYFDYSRRKLPTTKVDNRKRIGQPVPITRRSVTRLHESEQDQPLLPLRPTITVYEKPDETQMHELAEEQKYLDKVKTRENNKLETPFETVGSDETHMAFYSYCREHDIRFTGIYERIRGLRMALDEFGFGRLTPDSPISLVKSTFKNHYNIGAALYGQPQIPTKKRRTKR